MREIKFRVWDTWTDKMYYPKDFSKIKITIGTSGQLLFHIGNHLLNEMQFTGLRDRNGKEIWEGDIVSFGERGGRPYEIVEWSTESNRYDAYTDSYAGFRLSNDPEFCVVVGNIYENKNLCDDAETNS